MTVSKVLFVTVLLLATLACSLSVPPEIPVFATQTPQDEKPTSIPHSTPTPTSPPVVPVFGCWNVRKEPSVESDVLRVACGGSVELFGWADNGFVRLIDGYMCGRAFGENVKCQ